MSAEAAASCPRAVQAPAIRRPRFPTGSRENNKAGPSRKGRLRTRRRVDQIPSSPRPGWKLDSQQHLKEIPARCHAHACRGDRKHRRNSSDQYEDCNSEQPERDRGAEGLENERYHQQSCNGDHDITMPELHRLAWRRPPAIDADKCGAYHQDCAEEQWKEPGARQRDTAEIEQQSLPREERAGSAQHAGNENTPAAIAERPRKASVARLARFICAVYSQGGQRRAIPRLRPNIGRLRARRAHAFPSRLAFSADAWAQRR